MPYVDGFLLPVPKRNLAAYRRMAAAGGKIFRKHGALQFCECVGDDLKIPGMLSFTRAARCKPGETVFFSFIVYKSRADRDRVNKAIMKDPALEKMMQRKMPFDMKRMYCGGFKVFVEA